MRRIVHCLALAALLFPAVTQAQALRLVEWVENAPVSDNTKIALGFPVPIPVDTPLPFDGFRSYAGLHMRHQELALTTPWVHGEVVGTTRMQRNVWAYRLGDADRQTADGLPEQAMLANGGIHAREWQTPEVATGIIERLALGESDHHLLDYLRDNANIVVIPVLNVDGFLQTQRYPGENWVGGDPDYPDTWPRDGRMRRKNLLGADENLASTNDHLQGVDLNRNNAPFWASSTSSSADTRRLVYHGAGAASEPETQALDAAAQLGPADRLSMYTDIHSYSQVHLWSRNANDRQAKLTDRLLSTFSEHHRQFPAGKHYPFTRWYALPVNRGIGTTGEYFTHTYQVPGWTLEVEPSDGTQPGLPGQSADYGGLARNGHDGFILPESEVERVRTQLAETFTVAYYQQAGPPAIRFLRLIDEATGAVVFDAGWNVVDETRRALHTFQAQPLQLDRDYRAWVAWNKPMRWRENGVVAPLPGKTSGSLTVDRSVEAANSPLTFQAGEVEWLDQPGDAPAGYLRYRDDAATWTLSFPADETNLSAVTGTVQAVLGVGARDMVDNRSDADPATVTRWSDGAWAGYEDSNAAANTDTGGTDKTLRFQLTSENLGDPFVIEPGTTAAWFDIERDGEGFLLEILPGARAVMYWFTYGQEGEQDWYIAEGEVRGNRLVFPEMIRVSGGVFGPGFDPDLVVRTPVGSASFLWSSCDAGEMSWVIDGDGGPYRQGRMNLYRLTNLMGLDCTADGMPPPDGQAPLLDAANLSGSWYDPTHSGEGYVLEVLADQRVLVYWFSYDAEGKRRWFYGTGAIEGDRLVFETLHTTAGGLFGSEFDPENVEVLPWGTLELELACNVGTARFSASDDSFPAGELDLQRLTTPEGLDCADP